MKPEGNNDDATGLPILRSWRAVYFFVMVLFAAWIALLVVLERAFS